MKTCYIFVLFFTLAALEIFVFHSNISSRLPPDAQNSGVVVVETISFNRAKAFNQRASLHFDAQEQIRAQESLPPHEQGLQEQIKLDKQQQEQISTETALNEQVSREPLVLQKQAPQTRQFNAHVPPNSQPLQFIPTKPSTPLYPHSNSVPHASTVHQVPPPQQFIPTQPATPISPHSNSAPHAPPVPKISNYKQRAHTKPRTERTPGLGQQIHPDHTNMRAIDSRNYFAALDRATIKTAAVKNQWNSDPSKYRCFLNSSFACEPMHIVNLTHLPESFRTACAPSFIIPGTAKSGTTSLYFYLVEHPQVHQALSGQFNKEVRFFSEQWSKETHWYLQQFPPITKNDFSDQKIHMISGEASPTYFYEQLVPALIKATLPKVKLIVLLRDPVQRAYSDKMQLLANGVQYINDSYDDMKYQIDAFNECFTPAKLRYSPTEAFFSCYNTPKLWHNLIQSHPYIMDSIYVYQVRNWLRVFPREQLLFIKAEDMYLDAVGVMNRVTEFLGLCPFDWDPHVKTIHNRKAFPDPPIPPAVKTLLTDFYRNFTAELYDVLDYPFSWDN